MFALATPRASRRPSLTPMIDVVFLLLVFFMLAARFGVEGTLDLALAGGDAGEEWRGPPRLVEVRADSVLLNGVAHEVAALADALAPLMEDEGDPILLRAAEGVGVQRVVAVMEGLSAAGLSRLVLVQ